MDRQTIYVGQIPLAEHPLLIQQAAMIGFGWLAQAMLGTATRVIGLACTPTTPASMTVNVGSGMISQLSSVEATAWSELPQQLDPLVKIGINLTSTPLTLTAPTTSGQSINYLVQAKFQESDAVPVVLPYYNSDNPSQPYMGQDNNGLQQYTQRIQRVALQLKAGTPAATGSQTTPAADVGWTALHVITVGYGATTVTAGNIVTLPTAPFLQWTLPDLAPGFSRLVTFTASGTWVVPAGVTRAKVTVTGGGGGGAGCTPSGSNYLAGGGGGAGGTSIRVLAGLVPGTSIPVTVGAGGAAGAAANGAGGDGGLSSFGAYCSATGGKGASWNSPQDSSGGQGGVGSGGDMNLSGGWGSDGMGGGRVIGGNSGPSFWGGGGRAGAGGAAAGGAYGAGGAGPYNIASAGAAGAAGVVVVEY